MGTSGNVDTISPFKTKTYRDGGNAAEGGGVPMCTLRNFPHLTGIILQYSDCSYCSSLFFCFSNPSQKTKTIVLKGQEISLN